MQYLVRQIIRATSMRMTDDGASRHVSRQAVSYLPARNKEDALRTVDNLDGGASDHWRERSTVYQRSFDVVLECHASDGKRMLLSEDDIRMIASEYTDSDKVARAAE